MTITDGACSGRLVGDVVHAYGDPGAVGAFAAAAGRRPGSTVLLRRSPPAGLASASRSRSAGRRRAGAHYKRRKRAWKKAEARRERRLGRVEGRARTRDSPSAHAVGFTGFHDAPVDGTGRRRHRQPVGAGPGGSAPTRIATYGDTPAAMDVLVEVLLGQAPAPGRLPVGVPGVERTGC